MNRITFGKVEKVCSWSPEWQCPILADERHTGAFMFRCCGGDSWEYSGGTEELWPELYGRGGMTLAEAKRGILAAKLTDDPALRRSYGISAAI